MASFPVTHFKCPQCGNTHLTAHNDVVSYNTVGSAHTDSRDKVFQFGLNRRTANTSSTSQTTVERQSNWQCPQCGLTFRNVNEWNNEIGTDDSKTAMIFAVIYAFGFAVLGVLIGLIIGLMFDSELLCLVIIVAAPVFGFRKGKKSGKQHWRKLRDECDKLAEQCNAD